MDVDLFTEAEGRAKEAEKLNAFLGVSLLNIKQKVAALLAMIGRDEIFDQYTRHDISHINEMLKLLDWLIPERTKEIMSPADWLLIVLSIYFHDLGMLVTKREFKKRAASGFPQYCQEKLFGGDNGKDYRAKVELNYPEPEEAERFLYQEFVRENHAKRICEWIDGKCSNSLGVTEDIMLEVNNLLGHLGRVFRRDLALVCESHHLDDLGDIKKYRVSQPYANSDNETANVQYAAAILRTADLLHITSDRTPSIAYKVINPTDPISQEEWAKQMAVIRVRPQMGRNKKGDYDDAAPRDTIEVHAHFTQENGFFGLTSYLSYVEKQLRETHRWISEAHMRQRNGYIFPWIHINDEHIETEGFIRDTFEFNLDQAKILDLLTGHTLYNNTDVVVRELVQNALDAVRLQEYQDDKFVHGEVHIHWDSENHTLSVRDNGTGMTQQIIENHLLKVGSSRYQDPDFQRDHPNFYSISRFGIGVLSAFMIADTVEITTCNSEEAKARQISLRSVHGKYLIRLLDKASNKVDKELIPHGTIVKLTIRASVQMPKILATAQKWFVIPGCPIFVTIDNDSPIKIGFSSPKDALEDILRTQEIKFNESVKIVQKEIEGVTLAYALRWSNYFNYWNFIAVENFISDPMIMLGICVEGVRVSFSTPGYDGQTFLAIANATGKDAPQTNVARTHLEISKEFSKMLCKIYDIYCRQIEEEICKLYQERHFSLTWAAQEATYLMAPLVSSSLSRQALPLNLELLQERINDMPMLIVEHKGERKIETPRKLHAYPCFWTIDCPLFYSAEWLLREVASNASLDSLLQSLSSNFQFPHEPLYCESKTKGRRLYPIYKGVLHNKEVDRIVINADQRRLDLRWVEKSNPPRWLMIDLREEMYFSLEERRLLREITQEKNRTWNLEKEEEPKLYVGLCDIEVVGMKGEVGVVKGNDIYIPYQTAWAQYIISFPDSGEDYPGKPSRQFVMHIIASIMSYPERIRSSKYQDVINMLQRSSPRDIPAEIYFNFEQLVPLTQEIRLFSPSIWFRF